MLFLYGSFWLCWVMVLVGWCWLEGIYMLRHVVALCSLWVCWVMVLVRGWCCPKAFCVDFVWAWGGLLTHGSCGLVLSKGAVPLLWGHLNQWRSSSLGLASMVDLHPLVPTTSSGTNPKASHPCTTMFLCLDAWLTRVAMYMWGNVPMRGCEPVATQNI